MLLLAQLVAPPLQPGPVRLPATAPEQRPRVNEKVFDQPTEGDPNSRGTGEPSTQTSLSWRPNVQGKTPYSSEKIQQILHNCGKSEISATLKACAAALTAQLIQDGYINSRVYNLTTPAPGSLEVVLGTIAELRITSEDDSLRQQVQLQLNPLIGSVLHLPTLERALINIRKGGTGDIKGGMGRLGSDPTKAVVSLNVARALPKPLMADLRFGNNGSVGSGEWRTGATLLQQGLIKHGDTALLFLELNSDGQLELGSKITSATYTWPLNDRLELTGSFGYSDRRFVEFRKPAHDFRFRTLQSLLQLENVMFTSPTLNWGAAVGFSTNRTDSYKNDRSFPLVAGGGLDGWARSGFLKLSTNVSGVSDQAFWSANAYITQGIAGVTLDDHLHNLNLAGISPGEARAIGGIADISWKLSTGTQLNLRAACQVALAALPGNMTFSIGSDVGLRGLPGSLIAGDSGYLSMGEIVWTAWQSGDQNLALIPYVGIGGIHTDGSFGLIEDSIGVGGLIGRYRNGRWEVELGWTDTFNSDDNPGLWTDWVLGHGLHTKLRYSF